MSEVRIFPRALKVDPVNPGGQQTGRHTDATSKTRSGPAGGMWGAAAWLSASNREVHEPRLTVAPSGVVTGVWKLATGHKVVSEQNFWLQGMSTATPTAG